MHLESKYVDIDLRATEKSRKGEREHRELDKLSESEFSKAKFFGEFLVWISHGGDPQGHSSRRIHTTRLVELDSPAAA